jgi:hypothetical protein
MEIRNDSTTVTTIDTLPETDQECHNCEDGVFVQDGYELICSNCSFSPSPQTRSTKVTAWERHRKQIDSRLSGEKDGRPRLVGGYPDAYWGDGAYEYDPIDGFRV